MLMKFMENLVNISNGVSFSGVWILDANYKKMLPSVKSYLDLFCTVSKYSEVVATI